MSPFVTLLYLRLREPVSSPPHLQEIEVLDTKAAPNDPKEKAWALEHKTEEQSSFKGQ